MPVGLFANETYGGVNGLLFGGGIGLFLSQLLGVISVFLWSIVLSLLMFLLLKHTIGIRVSRDEEIEGLDLAEHGAEAYPDFKISV